MTKLGKLLLCSLTILLCLSAFAHAEAMKTGALTENEQQELNQFVKRLALDFKMNEVITIAPKQYLLFSNSRNWMTQGIFLIDMVNNKRKKLIGGAPTIMETQEGDNGDMFMLVKQDAVGKGIYYQDYALLHLMEKGSAPATITRLFTFTRDAEADSCGRGKEIKLTTATLPKQAEFMLHGENDLPEIDFTYTEENCDTGKTREMIKRFSFKDEKAIELAQP